jgi:hypothetical protein
MSAPSNTPACFEEFIGQKVIGCLFDALPVRGREAAGSKTLIFEDGRGLTISSTGSYWIERVEDVRSAVTAAQRRLARTKRQIEGVLDLAGAPE